MIPKEEYGPVFVSAGTHKGRVFYYDDDETPKTAICYVGHPLDFCGYYDVQRRYLREPTIDELMKRREEIQGILVDIAIEKAWETIAPRRVHSLWSERMLIEDTLVERRMYGELGKLDSDQEVFLCHCSADKGWVRMVHDDLKHLGVGSWLDENKIKVGDSIVSKIDEGLASSKTMIVFLSSSSVKSMWTKKEWQSFLARTLSGNDLKILPVLLEQCDVPKILADIKYADFRTSYYEGFRQIHDALK
jgi:hypothetical protein